MMIKENRLVLIITANSIAKEVSGEVRQRS